MAGMVISMVAVLVVASAGEAGATQYEVVVDTRAVQGSPGAVVLGFTSSSPEDNEVGVLNFEHDGVSGLPETQGGLINGDIILLLNPAPFTAISDGSFLNELLLPFDSFGTAISFTLQTTENAPNAGELPDEFSFYIVNEFRQPLFATADPLGADALFAICIDGTEPGLRGIFAPATFTKPNLIEVTVPGTPIPPAADHYVVYKARATKRDDLPTKGKFPGKDYNLLLDDLLLPNSAADDPENYQVKNDKGLGVPAMKNAESGPSDPTLHYLRYQIKEAKEGAGVFDESKGEYPKAAKHVKRRWELTNQFGTIGVTTKKVDSLLVPAAKDLDSAPNPPADAPHYVCYQAQPTKDVTDQTPDTGKGKGRFRKDIEAYFEDQFLNTDCATDADGNVSFAGSPVEGKCLFKLKKVKFLCNSVIKDDVGGDPARVTNAPAGSTSTPATAGSLLCYQVTLSAKILSQEAADLAGATVGVKLKQNKHTKRSPHIAPGNQFPAPLQVDTTKTELACIPTLVNFVAPAP